MKAFARSITTLPPAAGVVSVGALAAAFACEIGLIQRSGPVCPCPVPFSLVAVVCMGIAACVVALTLSRWNLIGMLEAGFACGLATGTSVAAGMSSIEGRFDLSFHDVGIAGSAFLAIGLGAVSAIALVVAVTLVKMESSR